jgi:ABC-type transport system substrate-binding protein
MIGKYDYIRQRDRQLENMQSSNFEDTAKGIAIGTLVFIFLFSAFPVHAAQAATGNGKPYFSITLSAPSTNPVRRQWAAIIQNSFVDAGIAANLVYVASFTILSETIFGAQSAGKLYNQGGYDAFFVGAGGGTALPDFGTQNVLYYRSATASDLPPAGNNWYWWKNATFNQLALKYNVDFNASDRVQIAKEMVRIAAQERPGMTILYPSAVYAYDPSFKGWATSGISGALTATTAERDFVHWNTGAATTINMAETGDIDNINILPTTVQNTLYSQNVAVNLAEPSQEPDGRAVGTYACDGFSPCTGIASNIVSSSDHLTWTESVRPHFWQDSAQVTADDYVYGNLIINLASYGYVGLGTQQSDLGLRQTYTFLNGTTSYVNNGTLVGHTAPAGWNSTSDWKALNVTAFSFTVPSAYIFTNPLLTSVAPLPKHLFEQFPVSSLTSGPFAGFTDSGSLGSATVAYHWNPSAGGDGKGTAAGGAYGGNGSATKTHGVITDGPYIYAGYDTVSQTATIVKNNAYWNITAGQMLGGGLAALGEFTASSIHFIHVTEKTAAIAGLATHTYNVLDSQYTFNKDDEAAITSAGGFAALVSDPSNGYQIMALNDNSPIWGDGTATPLGQSTPAKAHQAALDIRHAMSVLIPRQQIVNQLLQGLGTPGITEFYDIVTGSSIYYQIYQGQGINPDPYDPALAQQLLSDAGYNTGSQTSITLPQPPQISPTCTITSTSNITVPSFLLGNSLTFSGAFIVSPGTFAGQGGAAVTLQQSTDNGTTWSPVAFAQTNEGTYYSFTYQPTFTGTVQYRVFYTGIPWSIIQARSISSAGRVESLVPPQANLNKTSGQPLGPPNGNGLAPQNITDTQYTLVQTYKVGTLSDVVSGITSAVNTVNGNALCTLDKSISNSTSSALTTLNNNIQQALTTLGGNSAKSSDVAAINSQLTTLTDIAYAALAVAVILGLAAIALASRKRKPS